MESKSARTGIASRNHRKYKENIRRSAEASGGMIFSPALTSANALLDYSQIKTERLLFQKGHLF
jgi:hypothetical protein